MGDNFAEVQSLTGAALFVQVDPEDRLEDPEIVAQVFDRLHSTWVGVKSDQWIIRGVQGEFYPCAPDVFVATYDPELSEFQTSGMLTEDQMRQWEACFNDLKT